MGVRGLTTYIASNAERFLDPFELHDCDLVIDGDNLCIQLFVRSEVRMGAFGGNYDHYFRAIVEFFELLRKCNVRSFVLLDGGYEKSKLKTVRKRLLGRIHFIKNVKACSSRLIIPLLIREVFVDALRAVKVPFMRCLLEADNEIAILARKLDCPVLSYDSDFYIHNVKYIPYVTITHKLYRKVIETDDNYEIQLVNSGKKRKNRVLARQGEGAVDSDQPKESYCYLDCSLYTIENLIGSEGRLQSEMLPLFATLLGNDYIDRRVLSRFYTSMKVGKVSRKVALHQRRIVAILKWLQHHSVKSAMKTILNQVQGKHRETLTRQLQGAMYGYNCEECISYEYFGFDQQQEVQDAGDKFRDYLEAADDDIEVEESVPLEGDSESSKTDERTDDDEDDELTEGELSEDQENEIENECNETTVANTFDWEPWLLDIYQAARTPRYVVDLYYSGLYVNYPQAEDISKPDSNEICYDILRYICALLKSSKKGKSFRYFTRCEKVAKCQWITFRNVSLPEGIIFNPNQEKNVSLFKVVFEDFPNSKDIFATVENLPAGFQLYFLALIFWICKSQAVTCVHIHSLLICMFQLQIIDKRLSNKSRGIQVFQKNHKTYLESQKQSFKKGNIPQITYERLTKKQVAKFFNSVSKPESILTYEMLIPHFSIHNRQQRKQAEFDYPTAHTFAELQAVVLNLFTLNALLRQPFEPIRMHELYNGLFIHNVYQTLKSRPDPLEYVKTTVYRYSGTMFALHRALYRDILKLAPELEKRNHPVKAKPRKKRPETGDRSKRNQVVLDNDCVLEAEDGGECANSEQESFNDMNNQFSQLLTLT